MEEGPLAHGDLSHTQEDERITTVEGEAINGVGV